MLLRVSHFKAVKILERNPRPQTQLANGLHKLRVYFLDRAPLPTIERAISWADSVDHDGYFLDRSMMYREFGAEWELMVRIEAV